MSCFNFALLGDFDLSVVTSDELLLASSRIGHLPLMSYSFALGAKKTVQDATGKSVLHNAVFSVGISLKPIIMVKKED